MQNDIDKRDEASKARVDAGNKRREARKKFKELKKQYKRDRANNADSTEVRRRIKENYQKSVTDLERQNDPNKTLSGSRVEDDSIDKILRIDPPDQIPSIPSESGVEAGGWYTVEASLCINGQETDVVLLVRNP